MRTLLTVLAIVGLLTAGAVVYAHGPNPWGFGHMTGQAYGGHMMGSGFGRHMMGWSGYGYDKKFLDETADLRKKLNDKQFEYYEALRNPDTKEKEIARLEQEIQDIQESISKKAPRTAYRGFGGYGCRW
jgi:uncharacterized protein (UPF0335 family)